MRDLTVDDVRIEVIAEQDDGQVRGSFASGDQELDRRTEDEILRRLEAGDVWAWADVTVRATWGTMSGEDNLCGCSYANEAAFREEGGYFGDMVQRALDDLNGKVRSFRQALDSLQAPKWACGACGSDKVQMAMWVKPNTGEIVEPVFDHPVPHLKVTAFWCDECNEERELVKK